MNNKTQKLIIGLGLGLLCAVIVRSALSKSAKAESPANPPAAITLAQNDSKPAQPSVAAASPSQTSASPESDGKTVLPPDGKEVLATDGKTVLPPDGKEPLPPVGEGVGAQPQMVDPARVGAPTEYEAVNNPLLAPPSPQNVTGAPVSPETR